LVWNKQRHPLEIKDVGYKRSEAHSHTHTKQQPLREHFPIHQSKDSPHIHIHNGSQPPMKTGDTNTVTIQRRMSRKERSGTRAFFTRLFVKPYESVETYGSVHDLARIGGVSMLVLPKKVSPDDIGLAVPTRFAVTADHLAEYGERKTLLETPRAIR
jgi:hypothetical protein